MNSESLLNEAREFALYYGPKLVGAILVGILGLWLIKIISNALGRTIDKSSADESLKPFLKSMASILLKVLLAISVLSMLGVAMTSFIAILGAAGLAVGLALSGTLQNFAGGVMILIFKPFKVEEVIEAQGYLGKVSDIQIFNTILKTFDNKVIIIPNGELSTSALTNYSRESQRRVDWTFGIGYGDDVDQAKSVMQRLCEEDTRILKDPEVLIAVSELADSSVNFAVRAWVNADDYWLVYFDMNEKIYKTFNQEGLNIPYPQMDVHIQQPTG